MSVLIVITIQTIGKIIINTAQHANTKNPKVRRYMMSLLILNVQYVNKNINIEVVYHVIKKNVWYTI